MDEKSNFYIVRRTSDTEQGSIYAGVYKKQNTKCLIKKVSKELVSSSKTRSNQNHFYQDSLNESRILKTLKTHFNPNVICMLDEWSDNDHYYLVTEYCAFGNLWDFLRSIHPKFDRHNNRSSRRSSSNRSALSSSAPAPASASTAANNNNNNSTGSTSTPVSVADSKLKLKLKVGSSTNNSAKSTASSTDAHSDSSALDAIGDYSEAVKACFKQIVYGLLYLHNSRKICHLNLSLENVLISSLRPLCLKICDFGFSQQFNANSNSNAKTQFECETPFLGNAKFSSPEVYQCRRRLQRQKKKNQESKDNNNKSNAKHLKYNARLADVWCLGTVLFQSLTALPSLYNRMPDESKNYLFKYVMSSELKGKQSKLHKSKVISEVLKRYKVDKYVDQQALDLMARIFCYEKDRISLTEICAHPFLKSVMEATEEEPERTDNIRIIRRLSSAQSVSQLFPQLSGLSFDLSTGFTPLPVDSSRAGMRQQRSFVKKDQHKERKGASTPSSGPVNVSLAGTSAASLKKPAIGLSASLATSPKATAADASSIIPIKEDEEEREPKLSSEKGSEAPASKVYLKYLKEWNLVQYQKKFEQFQLTNVDMWKHLSAPLLIDECGLNVKDAVTFMTFCGEKFNNISIF